MLGRVINVLVEVNDSMLGPPRLGLLTSLDRILVCSRWRRPEGTAADDQPDRDVYSHHGSSLPIAAALSLDTLVPNRTSSRHAEKRDRTAANQITSERM
jgi:hypothetical protein